jgi:branched-chain amino acid transport system ATP-binding protein
MLRLENVTVAYGKHEALHCVSLDVEAGRTTVILGANGAGKTTLLNTIAGMVRPQPGGRILFEGRAIEAEPTHRMVAAGIALVPEGRRLFGQMTVIDNLRMGAYARHARAAEEHRLERVLAMFPRLAERRGQLANTMSGGEQQMVAIARALMSGPKLLLLDEPSLGLSPLLVKELFATLHAIKGHGQSVILVEQSVRQSLRIADYVYVLENGRIVRSGPPGEMERDEAIQRAYLGLTARAGPAPAALGPAAVPARAPSVVAPAAARPAAPSAPAPLAARPIEAPPALRPSRGAGGFVHPYARGVAPAPGAHPARREEEQSMDRLSFSVADRSAGAGFFHPFARSIGQPRPVPSPAPKAAAPAEPVPKPAARPATLPTGGGFVNPQARPVRV